MTKSAQSLLDLFNLLSGERMFVVFQSPVTNKEAQFLFRLWQTGQKDEYGRISIPDDIDFSLVQKLTDKKLLRPIDMRLATQRHPVIEITEEGKKIIRDIVLYAEKSKYEGGIENIDYEEIYRTIKLGPGVKKPKVASKQSFEKNWLHRVCE